MVLHALAGPAAGGGGPARHADGPLHRRDIRADGRAGEAGGHHPPMGRRDRVVGAALLGALPDGLGLAGHTFCPTTLYGGYYVYDCILGRKGTPNGKL